jgi:hypothetical protein
MLGSCDSPSKGESVVAGSLDIRSANQPTPTTAATPHTTFNQAGFDDQVDKSQPYSVCATTASFFLLPFFCFLEEPRFFFSFRFRFAAGSFFLAPAGDVGLAAL